MTKTLEEVLKDVIFCDGHGDKECWFLERENDGKPKKGKNGKTEPFRPSVLKKKHDGRYKDEKGNPVVLIEADVSDRYHVYSKSEKKDFMFIMETPGKKESYEKKNKKNGVEFCDYVEGGKLRHHNDLKKYAILRQENFRKWIDEILKLFEKNNLIDTINTELDKGINQKNFFDYFHATDVRKCADGNTKNCFEKFLKNEIEKLKPKLIFCFGREAWNQIYRKYKPIIVNDNKNGAKEEVDITKISDVHGYLFNFKIDENSKEIYILPCIHFSGTARNSAPRNSYMDYFKKGLTEYRGKQEK